MSKLNIQPLADRILIESAAAETKTAEANGKANSASVNSRVSEAVIEPGMRSSPKEQVPRTHKELIESITRENFDVAYEKFKLFQDQSPLLLDNKDGESWRKYALNQSSSIHQSTIQSKSRQ